MWCGNQFIKQVTLYCMGKALVQATYFAMRRPPTRNSVHIQSPSHAGVKGRTSGRILSLVVNHCLRCFATAPDALGHAVHL